MTKSKPASSALEVRQSLIHGQGAFATRAIRAGTVIGQYTGRRYTAQETDHRRWDNARTYVFGLSDGSLIDGSQGGNATRHINHSCTPNCVAYELEDAMGALSIEIEALRRIAPGEELFLDYSLDIAGDRSEAYPCTCGAADCRGTMAAPDPALCT
jgi:SET domain-containing protein